MQFQYIIASMYYNESSAPLFSRNPLADRSNHLNTINTTKKNSVLLRQSVQYSKKSAADPFKSRDSADYTFEPKVCKNGQKKRSIEKFLKDQQHFLMSKEIKIQQLRNQINRIEDDENTGTPLINKDTKQISVSQTNTLRNTNIFQRLSRERAVTSYTPQENMFSPKILDKSKSLVRKLDVSTLLYEDAKRRQEKQQYAIQSERKQRDLLTSPKINTNTNALVLKKIHNQFNQLVTDEQMNPLLALSVLQELFNVDLNPNKQSPDNNSVQRLINLLIGKCYYGQIRATRLWQFIKLIIMGEVENTQFSSEEEKEISQNYYYFYKERMTRERKTISPDKPTFRPKTLSCSNKLAHSFREKTCQKIDNFVQNQKINIHLKDGNYTIQDLFIIQHHKKLSDNQRKKIQKQNKEFQQCTFKPNIAPSSTSLTLIKKKPKIALRAPTKTQYLKTQYTQNTQNSCVSQQKQKLNNSKIYPLKSREQRDRIRRQKQERIANLTDNIKDVEKVMMRMSVGRQKRQYSKKALERGYPKNENWAEYQKQMHRSIIQNNKKLIGFGSK